MASLLHRIGRFAAQHPRRVVVAWLLLALTIIGTSSAFGRDLQDSFEVPGLDSQQAVDLLAEAESDTAGLTARIVVSPLDAGANFFDSAEAQIALAELQAGASALTNVLTATDPASALASGPEEAAASGSVSPDGRVALIQLQYPVVEELDAADLEELDEFVAAARVNAPLQVEFNGDLVFAFNEPETGLGEMIGVVAAVIVLLVAFGSVVAMGLPIGLALFGLVVGVSSMSLVTYLIEIPSWAPQIASMVGLGVGIDYALFLVTRHREFLADGLDTVEAAGRAVATAGQAVVFAGGTVVIAILGLAVAGVPFMTAAGVATSVLVAIMVLASVTLLPAFLGLAGPWIDRLSVRRSATELGMGTVVSRRWESWGRHVASHAWAYTLGVTTLLIAATAPVLALQLGFPDDGSQPVSTSQRRAYDLIADGFGPGSNGPLVIAVDIADDPNVLDPLVAAIAADPGVVGVVPPTIDDVVGVATVVAIPASAPQAEATVDTVDRLRTEVFPAVLDDSPARAHVGGLTANFADIGDRVSDRLPLFIAAVVLLSFLLLMVVFRSVLVPLKAAVLNLLSIGAAYGVLVVVFQWGWGSELIGLETTVPIVSFIPMFMFAILFGLSMDYEVFLLSRVREEYTITGDNDRSVITGLASTARVITSAALIMISVFSGFVLSDDPTTKMFGLGLATAIFVDASIVRMVLVPASMKLLGDANWWLPGWLDRILPSVSIDGAVDFGEHLRNEHLSDPDAGPAARTGDGEWPPDGSSNGEPDDCASALL